MSLVGTDVCTEPGTSVPKVLVVCEGSAVDRAIAFGCPLPGGGCTSAIELTVAELGRDTACCVCESVVVGEAIVPADVVVSGPVDSDSEWTSVGLCGETFVEV